MSLSDNQIAELNKKLDPSSVKKRPDSGMSYVEGWHVIAEANRIFGHAEWSSETVELTENTPSTKNQNGNHIVSFRAKVRVAVNGCFREGIGFGSGISKDIHSAYEGAIKEAETDARKRALMTFGNPFGLALYDKTQANVGVDVEPFSGQELLDLQNEIKEADINTIQTVKDKAKAAWGRMNKAQRDVITKAIKTRDFELDDIPKEFPSDSNVHMAG